MANEITTENTMLVGQTAYFKKTGSMVNHGKLNLANALSSRYYSEGYIAPDSVLHGTDLATTAEYKECETTMKAYLGSDWEEKEGERTIYTNANNINERLSSHEENIQRIADNIGFTGTELTYIRSTGTQCINTELIPTNHYVEIKSRASSTTNNTVLFGVDVHGYHVTWYNSKWHFGMGTYESSGGAEYACNTLHTFVYNKDHKFTIDGNIVATDVNAKGTSSLYLLHRPQNETTKMSAYIYYCKIYECDTDELVRDFIPCKDPDGVVCMYDKVTKTYFYNCGTGSFYAGSVVADLYKDELDYVETINDSYTIGGAYYSLTATVNANGFELDFTPMESFDATDTYEKYILCAATNSTTTENYYIRLCSYPGYKNGMIQIGLEGEKIDARLQMGKRQVISYKNGVLTLPDGTTHEIAWHTTGSTYLNWRLGNSRLMGEKDHSTIRIHSIKLYNNDTIASNAIPVKNNSNIAQLFNKTGNYLMVKSGIMKLGPVKEE